MTEDDILRDYLLTEFREEYLNNELSKRDIELIRDTFNFNVYQCKFLIKEIKKNIREIFGI